MCDVQKEHATTRSVSGTCMLPSSSSSSATKKKRERQHKDSKRQMSTHSLQKVVRTRPECSDSAASELLLSVANQSFSEERFTEQSAAVITTPTAIDQFPSFQALLHAATSVEPCKNAWYHAKADVNALVQEESTTVSGSRLQKRRERNRISCRRTRLKCKVEQNERKLVGDKRAERNNYLSHLQRELTLHQPIATVERDIQARHFITRSLHFQLVDREYDASWCCCESPSGRSALRNGRAKTPHEPGNRHVIHAHEELTQQWQVLAADYDNVDLEILQIQDNVQAEELKTTDSAATNHVCSCEWRFLGVSKRFLQLGRLQTDTVTGVTTLRFRGRRIESVDMRVTTSTIESDYTVSG